MFPRVTKTDFVAWCESFTPYTYAFIYFLCALKSPRDWTLFWHDKKNNNQFQSLMWNNVAFSPRVFFFSFFYSCITLVYEVLLWSSERQQHNIINVATVMSPGEFCSLYCVSWNIPGCVKRSLVLSLRHSLRFRHTHTHTHTNASLNIDSPLNTQHIFMMWHDGAEFGPRPPPVASPSVSPAFALSFLSFFLSHSFSFSLCLWLLSRWYISCSWHGSCIAYG